MKDPNGPSLVGTAVALAVNLAFWATVIGSTLFAVKLLFF